MPDDVTPSASKPATIQQVATTLGIHKSTVSNAFAGRGRISPELRARIYATATELGYEPDPLAQRLSNRAHSNVVCLCSGILTPGRVTEKVLLIQDALSGLGLEVPIYTPTKTNFSHDEAQAMLLRQVRRQRPQAIVCSTHSLNVAALAELSAYQQEGGIVVAYDLPIPLECDQIIFDRVDNAYQGARYLLEHGHRRIGLGISRLTRAARESFDTTQHLRQEGFRQALHEFGVEERPEWIFENETLEKGGSEMAQRFLAMKERPTGLCIVNDYVALAFMVEVTRAGLRLPDDVSLIGHDDQPVAVYCPVPLTSVSQPAEKIVQAVVQTVTARIQGDKGPPQTQVIRGELIERQSVRTLTAMQN